jgi:tripeptide aminopeptidase
MEDKALERFLEYVRIDTQSNDKSDATPSEPKELDLTRLLLRQLTEMGIKGEIDGYGRLYAWLPGDESLEPIGANAHVDTALEISGKGVKPQLIKDYDGGVIKLNDEYSMSPEQFPYLKRHIGDDLVVTSGDTLLGGDDKAGDAIIMAMLDYFVSHPEVRHHPISILFTPDEEIGRGPEHFDAKKFGAEYAYSFDGAFPELIQCENFNASHADVTIKGVSIHPGEAKGKMVNAARLAGEFDSLLPEDLRPEKTELREGFNHLVSMEGTVDEAKLHYIIRSFDAEELEKQKAMFVKAKDELLKKYPAASIDVGIGDDYRNMKECFDKDPRALKRAEEAIRSVGIEPVYYPIRGGTDGATFSFMGCPTPNLGTGSYNHHGRFEYLSVKDFHTMIDIAIALYKA